MRFGILLLLASVTVVAFGGPLAGVVSAEPSVSPGKISNVASREEAEQSAVRGTSGTAVDCGSRACVAGSIGGSGDRRRSSSGTGFRHNSVGSGEDVYSAAEGVWVAFVSKADQWVRFGMAHAPALVMGLFLVGLVPLLAIAGWLFRVLQPQAFITYNYAIPVGGVRSVEPFVMEQVPISDGGKLLGRDAFLELEGYSADGRCVQFPLKRDDLLVRIGREDDNEIQIRDGTVHRYHAAIERSQDSGISITDLSSAEGNGVTVNGVKRAFASLTDGDRIGLGAIIMKFRVKQD